MQDLISRQAAIDACQSIILDMYDNSSENVVPVKHGRWEKIGHIENTWLVSKCSECGYQTIDAGNYCTNCGAKMDLEGEKE